MRGEPVSDLQLLDVERTLRRELGGGDLHLNETNIRAAYRDEGLEVDSLLEFLRYLLDPEDLPAYRDIVTRQFSGYVAGHAFNADQIRFLRVVQNVFLQKRRLQRADLYDPPLTSFGHDAVDRWFTEDQVNELLTFVETLRVSENP